MYHTKIPNGRFLERKSCDEEIVNLWILQVWCQNCDCLGLGAHVKSGNDIANGLPGLASLWQGQAVSAWSQVCQGLMPANIRQTHGKQLTMESGQNSMSMLSRHQQPSH